MFAYPYTRILLYVNTRIPHKRESDEEKNRREHVCRRCRRAEGRNRDLAFRKCPSVYTGNMEGLGAVLKRLY